MRRCGCLVFGTLRFERSFFSKNAYRSTEKCVIHHKLIIKQFVEGCFAGTAEDCFCQYIKDLGGDLKADSSGCSSGFGLLIILRLMFK